jgi:hypothetical protein
MKSDQEYFWRRYEEEHAAAERAADERARRIHLELSARYAQHAAAIEELNQRSARSQSQELRLTQPGSPRGH